MQPAYQQEWHTLGQESILSPLIQFSFLIHQMYYENKKIEHQKKSFFAPKIRSLSQNTVNSSFSAKIQIF